MSDHVDVDLLADRQEGLVDPPTAARIDAHLDACAQCTALADDLRGVSDVLGAQPTPAMPDQVRQRITGAVADEQRARQDSTPVASLDQARKRRTRTTRALLAAAAAVVVVGVGGTLLEDAGLGGGTRSSESGALSSREDAAPEDTGPGEDAPGEAGEPPVPADEPTRQPPTLQEDGAESGQGQVAPRVQRELSLIEEVFVTRTVVPLRQRSGCVGTALDEPGWEGTSYAVDVHGAPGAVAFLGDVHNTARDVEGVLVRCGSEPEVLERERLRR